MSLAGTAKRLPACAERAGALLLRRLHLTAHLERGTEPLVFDNHPLVDALNAVERAIGQGEPLVEDRALEAR